MPRAPKSSRSAAITPEKLELWSAILDRAEAFLNLEPWKWIGGNSLLGVRDPVSGDIDWCTIMGQNEQTYGLAVYPGNAGYACLHRMYKTGPDEFDAMLQQTALVLTFNDRAGVTPDMAAILKACGRRYRGAIAWPELLVHEPGYFPAPPSAASTLQRMLVTLECLFSMCAFAASEPGWDAADAAGRVAVALPNGKGPVAIERRYLPTPLTPVVPMIPLDEVAIGRIRASGRRHANPILIDWFPSDAVIDGPEANGRPYYVMHILAIDMSTGMIVGTDLGNFSTIWTDLIHVLLTVGEKIGAPQQLFVRRPEALEILRPLALALNITLVHRAETTDVIRHFRKSFQEFMG